MERESMEFDVLIVGGGPAGLSAAIRLKQLAAEKGQEISVCLIEKAAEIGAHILSGAVMDPKALTELIPDWKEQGAPLKTAVTEDKVLFLTETGARQAPNGLLPDCFVNHGNYIVRLGNVVKWLGEQAEALGVEVYPGFAGAEILFDEAGAVKGVATGDMGLNRDGTPGPHHQPGMELHAKYTLFAEGCRGHLGKQLEAQYKLRDGADPQTYGIGIKELWEVKPENHRPGLVVHTAGWPMDNATYGGGFVYHLEDNLVAVGYVVGLNYSNPHLSPFEEMQRYKTHPEIRKYLDGGKRLAYGARAIAAGGLQSLPRLIFPGGGLIGDDAGFLNAARIKGSHAAIKSGMLAAEAAFEALEQQRQRDALTAYPAAFRESWLYAELHKTRNFKPYMKKGLYVGSLLFGIDQVLFKGKVPWTLHNTADHTALKPAAECAKIDYPKPDGVLTFDRLSSVFLSNTNHEEEQPCHLQLKDAGTPIAINLARYDAPEQRYCPAGVYEIVHEEAGPRLQINAQNCVHCKTCDIKDPTQNINWVVPQGGEGPIYQGM
ncbi:MAG: electron transfer flavoprotein-ubiquinone oxidoreductase [Thauera propionica]|jgi:electron-transferring-flavoprotein dehydrogenase|uniref:Electron transfer flavoprotein-ubiquinone oxidoreductase n=1 Tax=Thauera propionica TaxID=2019431 RepID=A0A235EYT0_9RHOO|nr:electron transfer flavoprotein-ubiquinone oxidoreductase [Thauera propionica]MDY0046858.1 electron transfer flavoprotein-ubiquinone oxidoreductase [Thauera propionica]OYD54150.1 electron transfer flavoprotein-ubiquinone oxidoreductase [Thauera propionica]